MNLLIVDDDKELCALLGEFLSDEGFRVDAVHDGSGGLERIREGRVDLVVLDVMLPGMDGLSLLRALRRETDVPVIMLTARGQPADRIVGLELGADDYLRKPFSAHELLARIRAVTRRVETRPPKPERIESQRILLDASRHEVFSDGQRVDLTAVEFGILEVLMRGAGRVMTREEIMDRVRGRSAGPEDRSIDMHVSNLRRKLGSEGSSIRTVRGRGYRFSPSPEGEMDS